LQPSSPVPLEVGSLQLFGSAEYSISSTT